MNAAVEHPLPGDLQARRCLVVMPGGTSLMGAQLCRMLEAQGFIVERARDGAHALQICWRSMPRVVFVPMRAGAAAGAALVRRLGRLPAAGPCAIFGYGEVADAALAGRMICEGAADCLLQPIGAAQLEMKLRQAGVPRPGADLRSRMAE